MIAQSYTLRGENMPETHDNAQLATKTDIENLKAALKHEFTMEILRLKTELLKWTVIVLLALETLASIFHVK